MSIAPFSLLGRFWRGNLHTHSTASDGRLAPQEVCMRYAEAGYDFIALTDHFLECYGFPVTDTRAYRRSGFTTLFGAELHTGRTELGNMWHILAVGLPLDFARTIAGESGPEIAARALGCGAFVAAAHPAWYGLTEGDVRSLGRIDAIEVFNGTAIDHNDKHDSWYMLDLMTMRGGSYAACATDDAHFHPDRQDAFRGWVQVKSETPEPEALLAALKAGAYYSSTGPQILDIAHVPGEKLRVRCSAANRILVTGYGAQSASVHGDELTEAEIDLKGLAGSSYFRVTVRDASGGRAWSNPMPL